MLPVDRVIGHKEYAAGRKTDPVYDMNWRRRSVAEFTPTAQQEEDMPLTPQDIAAISDAVANRGIGPHGAAWQTWNAAATQAANAAKQAAGLQGAVDKLADALARQEQLDPEALKGAVREAIADAVIDVDVNVGPKTA